MDGKRIYINDCVFVINGAQYRGIIELMSFVGGGTTVFL